MIGGIGYTNFDLWAAGRRPQNFYMLGSMGLAVPIALGVALAQPQRKVIALEGDGSILMQLGSLATVAGAAAEEPGDRDHGQRHVSDHRRAAHLDRTWRRHRRDGARCGHLAERVGGGRRRVRGADRLSLREDGPWLIGCRIDKEKPADTTERDPPRIRDQFMRGLGVKH